MLNGGSGVDVITKDTAWLLGLDWELIAFNVRIVDNRKVVPEEILRNVKIQVDGLNIGYAW